MPRYKATRRGPPARRFEREFGDDAPPDFGPRGRRSGAKRKRGSSASKRTRSADFKAGQQFERDRIARLTAPRQPDRDQYDGADRYSPDYGWGRRIGWRL